MNTDIFIKRAKSFAWRFGIALITFGLNWIIQNITTFGLPVWALGIIAYFLGEISKAWASYQSSLGKSYFGRIL